MKLKDKDIPQVEYQIIEAADNFVYGRICQADMMDIESDIEAELNDLDFVHGEVGSDDELEEGEAIYEEIRSASIAWLDESKYAKRAIKAMVEKINDQFFALDISTKPPEYQYTSYDCPHDHYDWHQDVYDDDQHDDFIRSLSLSLCMSADDFYEGAEFFIKDGSETNVRVFKMRYGDFIIFPAQTEHRVNALRAGVRNSLVIWYGHKPPNSKSFQK